MYIDDQIPRVSVEERKQHNLKFIESVEKNSKQKQRYSEQQLLEYYIQPKHLKVKHIYKDVEKAINLNKDLILPKLQLEKINLRPPEQQVETSPRKRRKRQYHYFASPLSNSINLKDLSTRSSHHNRSQFNKEKLDLTIPEKEINTNQMQKKSILLNELTKVSGGGNKLHKKIQFKKGTLENEFESESQIDDSNDSTPVNKSRDNTAKRKSIEEKEEEALQKIRYNMTFRGSVQKKLDDGEDISAQKKTAESYTKQDSDNEDNSSSQSSSSSPQEEEESSEELLRQSRISQISNESLTKGQKMKQLAQRLSMQPYLNLNPINPNQLQIKVKLKNQSLQQPKNNEGKRLSLFYQAGKAKIDPQNTTNLIQNQSFKRKIILQRQKTQMSGLLTGILSNEDLINIGNEVSVDEYSGTKFRERLQSLTGKQLEEIQQINEYRQNEQIQKKNIQQDELMLKLNKRERQVESQLKKNHKKLFNIAVKVKKSNHLDDEYKDINIFQKNIGYSLPMIHELKYFDVNSGQYKYLYGRSSLKDEVKTEQNEYYQMFKTLDVEDNDNHKFKKDIID